jgi:chromosome partitioning protein
MSHVLAIVNHKGGPGKTTTAVALARHWQRQRRRPLLIDLDPQANATRILGGTVSGSNNIGEVLQRRSTLDRSTQIGVDGIRLVGADIRLEDVAAALQGKSPNHMFLSNAIRAATEEPGVVIIDCAPSANILTINALVAATHALIVLDPELDAMEGARRMRTIVAWLRDELGRGPTIIGAVINKVQSNTLLHRTNLETVLAEIDALGIVPYRRGADADQQIDDAFAPIADRVWNVMENGNA